MNSLLGRIKPSFNIYKKMNPIKVLNRASNNVSTQKIKTIDGEINTSVFIISWNNSIQ